MVSPTRRGSPQREDKDEKKPREKKSQKASMSDSQQSQGGKMVRDLARSFAGADTDGNHRLSFDEFLNAVPAEMRTNKSTTQLQQMFANVDADGSGTVSALSGSCTLKGLIGGYQNFNERQTVTPLFTDSGQ